MTRSRKWLITFNNFAEKGFDKNSIQNILSDFKGLVYACGSTEIGQSETEHMHIFVVFKNAVSFETLKN